MSFVGGNSGFGQGDPIFVLEKSDLPLGLYKFVHGGGVLEGNPGAESDLSRDFPCILLNNGDGV